MVMVVDFFDRVYTNIKGKNKAASLKRFIIRVVSNLLIPIIFRLTETTKYKRISHNKTDKKIIVSLTTFPARIKRVWLVVECLMRQSIKPDIIILYLAESQFPNKEVDLPNNLKKYVKKQQLTIKFVDDLRSHKKYFYSFQDYTNDLVVLVDDDIFYPSYILENLIEMYEKFPDSIICSRAYEVEKNESKILPYEKWRILKKHKEPTYTLFHTSGGGTLYVPANFDKHLFDKEAFLKYCKYADDVWLNLHAQRSKIKTVKTNKFTEILPILNYNKTALKTHNVASGGNNKQIRDVIDFYEIEEKNLFV